MNKKVNCIMLVDDNEHDNFYHERVIMKNSAANIVIPKLSGMEALEYLKAKKDHPGSHPDLIFLDINMPGMNGWEFIKEYEGLDEELKCKIIVVMLTTSNNPDDITMANRNEGISEFRTKPLTKEMLEEVISKNF